MNKSHKVGRVHGWILYCGLIMPLLVAFLVDFVILDVIWVNMMSLSLRLVAVLILFVRARLWSFVPSSFPWALKILLYIIKSWNFQDLSDFAAAKAVNAFCIAWLNILYIFQKKWSMIKRLKLLKSLSFFGSTSIPGPHPSRANYGKKMHFQLNRSLVWLLFRLTESPSKT